MLQSKQSYDNMSIPIDSIVRLIKTGEITEIMHLPVNAKGSQIIKISKNQYINKNTGEVCEFKHTTDRSMDYKTFTRSVTYGQKMIDLNVKNPSFCRWITFTYQENMRDSERLYTDYKIFIKSARRKYGPFEYIAAAEPQGRGAWHLHVIFIFKRKAPFMNIKELSKLWIHGSVTIKSLDNIINPGFYLTAYLGDMESKDYDGVVNEKMIKTVITDGQVKRYIKRGRIHLYPSGFHIFRYSKGLLRPEKEYMAYSDAKKRVEDSVLIFKKTIELSDDTFKIYLTREIYMHKKSYARLVAYKLKQHKLNFINNNHEDCIL